MSSRFRSADAVMQLIYITVAVSLVAYVGRLLGMYMYVESALYLGSSIFPYGLAHFWTLLTYMFVSVGLFGTLVNLLLLFWFGHIALTELDNKQFVALHLFSGITAGLAYQMLDSLYPSVDYLCSNAGALTGIMVAQAVFNPDRETYFLFVGRVRMLWVVLATVALMLLFHSDNIPVMVSMCGGALGGYVFSVTLKNGHDMSRPFTYLIDKVSAIFRGKTAKAGDTAQTQYHYAENVVNNSVDDIARDNQTDVRSADSPADAAEQEEIERILAKIRTSGYSSLTEDEKQRIFK